jgi:hypothetical protein
MPLVRSLRRCAFAVLLVCSAIALADPKTTHTGFVRSARVQVRYRPNSWAGAAAERVLGATERDLDRIAKDLDVKTPLSVVVFVYDDVTELSAITGTNGNAGFSTAGEVHVPFANDQTRLHELVHVVSHTLPVTGDEARNQFFDEGLANAVLEFVDGVHVHSVAAFYARRNELPPLPELCGGDFYAWLRAHPRVNAYDIGGSWMRFLLDRFGAEKVKRYYTGTTAKTAFGTDAAELEKSWREFVAKFPLRPETETLLRIRNGDAASFPPYVTGLPPEILGRPADWTPLLSSPMKIDDLNQWNREDGAIAGTNPTTDWAVCGLGDAVDGDCAVRARIETKGYCAVSVQIGSQNRAMLVQSGTFVFRDANGIAQSGAAQMTQSRTSTDFLLVRRGAELEVWIDGAKVLTAPGVAGPAVPGIGVAQGAARFTDVRVRKLDAPKPR